MLSYFIRTGVSFLISMKSNGSAVCGAQAIALFVRVTSLIDRGVVWFDLMKAG